MLLARQRFGRARVIANSAATAVQQIGIETWQVHFWTKHLKNSGVPGRFDPDTSMYYALDLRPRLRPEM